MNRKSDAYEARCRELCLADGIDPDSRVLKLGSDRGMPAWTTYRDAGAFQAATSQGCVGSNTTMSIPASSKGDWNGTGADNESD
jgi:hypothetical protein